MSITIHQTPTGYPSAHSELWHVVESTNKATAGFQYVFDVYDGATMLTRVKNSPYGTDKLGVIDLQKVVQALVATNKAPALDLNDFAADTVFSWSNDYDVRYGEVSGGVLTANIASGTYKVYNRYPRKPWDNKRTEINGGQLLTNRPVNSNFYEGHPVVLSYFAASGQTWAKVGPSTDNYTGDNNAVVFSWNPTADLTFQLSGSVSGVVNTLNLKKRCSKYKPQTLMFLNAYGAWDSFTFVHGKLMTDVERKMFERQRWEVSGNAITDNTSGVYHEKRKVYAGEYTQKMVLTSDILSTGEYDWLQELVVSPLVYWIDVQNEKLYPVTVENSNYELKQDQIQKADVLELTIVFDSQNIQFR